jgi:ferrous iron transport protein A
MDQDVIDPTGFNPIGTVKLGTAARGFTGRITAVNADSIATGLAPYELERRLLEMGFVEGARVEIRHHGPMGRDPIAILVDHTLVALRRVEANAILVEPVADSNP